MAENKVVIVLRADTVQYMGAMERVKQSTQSAMNKVKESSSGIVGAFKGVVDALGGVRAVAMHAAESLVAVTAIKGLEINAELEKSAIAFRTLTGSAQKAAEMIAQLQDIAVHSPFNLEGLQHAARLLLSMGINTNQVIPYVKALADAVAAVGGGTPQLERAGLALAQISAKGKLSAEEMNQLAENGIPAWQLLADTMGVSVGELMKMSQKGQLLADQVIPKLIEGMEKRFGGAMQKASSTFSGMLETIKEQSELILGNLTKPLFDSLKSVMPHIVSFLQQFNNALKNGGIQEAFKNLLPPNMQSHFEMLIGWFKGFQIQIKNMDWDGIGAFIGLAVKNGLDTISGLGSGLLNKISTELQNGDFTSVLQSLSKKGQDLATGFARMFSQDLANAIKNGNAVAAGEAIGNLIMQGLQGLAKRGAQIGNVISSIFNSLDWAKIGQESFVNVVGFIAGFASALLDPSKWIEVIRKYWDSVLTVIISIMFAPEKWVGFIAKYLAKIPFVGTVLQKIFTWINQLGKPIRERFNVLFDGVGKSIVNAFKGAVKGDGIIATLIKPFVNAKKYVVEKIDELVLKGNEKLNSWGSKLGQIMGNVWNWVKTKVVNGINGIYNTLGGWFNKLVGIKNRIVSLFANMRISIPKFKLPHISVSLGTKNIGGVNIPYPKIDVKWYATGGIFTGPSVIGVGEKGDEAVVPLSNKSRMRPFAEAVAEMMGGKEAHGQVTVINNFNLDRVIIREEADIQRLAEELHRLQVRQNRAKGVVALGIQI